MVLVLIDQFIFHCNCEGVSFFLSHWFRCFSSLNIVYVKLSKYLICDIGDVEITLHTDTLTQGFRALFRNIPSNIHTGWAYSYKTWNVVIEILFLAFISHFIVVLIILYSSHDYWIWTQTFIHWIEMPNRSNKAICKKDGSVGNTEEFLSLNVPKGTGDVDWKETCVNFIKALEKKNKSGKM